jgi:HSP20 family protein
VEVETMLVRTDPFREIDRLTEQFLAGNHTSARPAVMPMDAWREGDTFVVEFDLPGVARDAIDLDVERNVVTVRAERPAPGSTGGPGGNGNPIGNGNPVGNPDSDGRDWLAAERPRGVFSRQLVLGDNLDTEHTAASYDSGVLTLRIPVAEHAKPRKILLAGKEDQPALTS